MSDMSDYLARKAGELGLERGEQLEQIQAYLDERWPRLCRAVSLNDGVLKVTTTNASLASELRMSQTAIIHRFEEISLARIIIQIQ
jgi:hypothetical protein